MPQSRTRKRRHQRRVSQARSSGTDVLTLPASELPKLLTNRDLRRMSEAMVAEQQGDLERALSRLRGVPRILDDPWSWEYQLMEMIELGADAESWQWARFSVEAAGRWLSTVQHPLVARVHRNIGEAAEGAPGPLFREYRGWTAGRAAVRSAIDGVLLFDELFMEVFLVQVAPELATRAGGGRDWATSPGLVYRLGDIAVATLTLYDHADGAETTVRHLGEAAGLGPDDLVYGHVIDVPGEPGRVFALPPIVVDGFAAQRLARTKVDSPLSVDDWCAALGAAVRSGDPYERPPLVDPRGDDREPSSPRVQELMGEGVTHLVAEALATVEIALLAFEVLGKANPAAAYHAGVALRDDRVLSEAMRRLTRPEHVQAWRANADVSHGLERRRFLMLAEADSPARPTSRLSSR